MRPIRGRVLTAAAVVLTVVALSGQTPARVGRGRPFTFALAGDSIITRKLSVYHEPEFLKLMDLVRGADAAFTNLEMLFHDYEPYPMHESGGTWMRADPALVRELVWAGFDLVSRANNHAGDYGVAGMRLTTKYVREAGLVQAGVGESLAEAREARFLDTRRARVGRVDVSRSLESQRYSRRRAGAPRPQPAAIHDHERRDARPFGDAPRRGARAWAASAG